MIVTHDKSDLYTFPVKNRPYLNMKLKRALGARAFVLKEHDKSKRGE